MTLTRKLLHVGATALMLSTVASVTTFVTADAAYAERGNGNGNSRSNRDRDRSSNRGQERQAERRAIIESAGVRNWGAIASELGNLNKAHANENARLNSSDPVHQALGAYAETGGISSEGLTTYAEAAFLYDEYRAGLLGTEATTTDELGNTVPVLDEFDNPVIITEDNIDEYALSFEEQSGLSPELIAAYDSLGTLTADREDPLSGGAVDALNWMLALEDPADGTVEGEGEGGEGTPTE